ncbi:phage portal protein [Anaeromassilibacillus senegalensis]|uniref:phage portal protein n=1 Tax=Anaeromassilibacillus senegalensis TaxID=1673717 RepID=UPI000680A1DB|nr:phage portal protein [Anaeromassilibacillus senegalensis]
MSVFSALFNSSKVYNFEQAFGVKDITTQEMRTAIQDWALLYYQTESTDKEDPCQRLPVAIVSKLTKTAFSEYEAASDNEYVTKILQALEVCRKKAMQQALIGGQCYLKPIFTAGGLCFSVVSRGNYMALGRNERDELTDIGTAERTVQGKTYYTLLERRQVDAAGYLTIESKLYQSDTENVLGTPVPLVALDKYAALRPVNVLPQPVHSLGLIPLRTPLENCVDGSPDPVSIYAPAAGLIHNINHNEAQINGEFERGESRIIVGGDMMEMGEDGKRRRLRDHVFTAVDEDPDDIGITIFSPAFREQSFLARKTEYLRNVESLIGLKRGLLSEVEAAERTATEVTSSEGDYNLTIIDFQQMWENAVREAVRVCEILGRMYQVYNGPALDPEREVSIDWGNGVLYDRDKAWMERKEMVAAGMLKPELALAWYFNLPCKTSTQLAKIHRDYMPEIQALLGEDLPLDGSQQESNEDVVDTAEDVAGKTLNGAQTQSLISVIAQLQAGQLTEGQAVNIVSVAIGVSKEEARRIIEGAE